MADHKIQITFDEATGELRCVHRCAVTVAGQKVGHAVDVELSPDVGDALRDAIDANREAVEAETVRLAVQHAAAVSGKVAKGVKQLKVVGKLGAVGGTTTKKGD